MSVPPTCDVPGFPKYPPRSALPSLSLDESVDCAVLDPSAIVDKWFAALLQTLNDKDSIELANLFVEESWWRDLVGLGWDITSKYGPLAISNYVLDSASSLHDINTMKTQSFLPQLQEMGLAKFIQAGFTFCTKYGSGVGVIRLANVGPDSWKAWTVFTKLEHLIDQERAGTKAMNGHSSDTDIQVLVIGAGQAGVALAAQLQHLGLQYLLIEKQPRVGGSWRNRYDTVKTHTPSYMDHFPFLSFPTNWPKNPSRDRVCEWIESYSRIMNLNVLTETSVNKIERLNEGLQTRYSVVLDTKGSCRTVVVKHIALSTGLVSDDPVQLGVPGQDTFGGLFYHSSQYKSASQVPNIESKVVTIIGSGTSAHDIAKDFADCGAKEVCIIQRNPIVVVSSESLEDLVLAHWKVPTLSVKDADLLEMSMPKALALTLQTRATQACAERDRHLLDGLEKAGMALRRGADGIGLLDLLLVKLGHFYIDQGAASMIIEGKIKVHRCKEGVKRFYDSGVELHDGTKINSDVIVAATGFKRCGTAVERLLGRDLAIKAKPQEWGYLDDESEPKGWWRPTGVPGLWVMTGSFSWSRQYSSLLALQIDAVERGLNNTHYEA